MPQDTGVLLCGDLMFPSFELFGKTIYMYGVMAAIGLLLAGLFVCRQIKKRKMDDNDAIVCMLIAAIGILVGSHILYAITNVDKWYLVNTVHDFRSFADYITLVLGGSVFYGGLIGGTIAGAIYIKAKKLDATTYFDVMAPAVPLFHSIARIGCFLGGCCYGVKSDFGFTCTHSLASGVNGVNRFPVQLLESGLNMILFLVLWQLLRKNKCKGYLFPIYLMSYAVIRFSDEFLRADAYRGFIFGISTSQFISILIFLGALAYIVIQKQRKKQAA